MNDYISKPFKPEQLMTVINKHAGKRKLTNHKDKSDHLTDIDYLREVCHNDTDFMREMLEVFVGTMPDMLEEMEKYINDSEWKSVGKIAHKTKPSFSFMGLKDTVELAKKLEEMGRDAKDVEKIPVLFKEFSDQTSRAMDELREILQQEFS